MAILSVKQALARRSESTTTGRSYERTYTVITSDPTVDEHEVRLATGVPRVNDPYPSDLTVLCSRVAADARTDNPTVWDVRAAYETPSGGSASLDPDPTARPAEYTFGTYHRDWPVWSARRIGTTGISEGPYMAPSNTAGDPFAPPLLYPQAFVYWRITKNQTEFDTFVAASIENAINTDNWEFNGTTWQPRRVLLQNINGALLVENGVSYFRVTYELHFHPDPVYGWDEPVLNAGFNELDGDGDQSKLIRITDLNDVPVSQPMLLNENGRHWLSKSKTTPNRVTTPYFIAYERPHPRLVFGDLNLV